MAASTHVVRSWLFTSVTATLIAAACSSPERNLGSSSSAGASGSGAAPGEAGNGGASGLGGASSGSGAVPDAAGAAGTSPTCDGDAGCGGSAPTCGGADAEAPGVPQPLRPVLGAYTGSVHAPAELGTLRPKFSWSTATPGACGSPKYELQVDDSCPLHDFSDCAFPSPEVSVKGVAGTSYTPADPLPVSMTVPVGSRYFWRVRACEGETCSEWSSVSYVEVGRLREDLNGDGYGEVVSYDLKGSCNAPCTYSYEIAEGSSTFDTDIDHVIDTQTDGTPYPIRFVGDVNADGFNDFSGLQGVIDGIATVRVFFGAASLSSMKTVDLHGGTVATSAFRARDFDGDGFADLAIPDGATKVLLYRGSSSLRSTTAPTATLIDPAGTAASKFSESADDVDLNGDGRADLVLLAGGASKAYVALGGQPFNAIELKPLTLDAECHGGAVAAAGDLNGDGFDDVAFGCPNATFTPADGSPVSGHLSVAYGGTKLPTATSWSYQLMSTDISGQNAYVNHLGADLVGGSDLTGDGISDLVVGYASAPAYTSPAVFSGTTSGPSMPSTIVYGYAAVTSVSLGDNNGDGLADLTTPSGWFDANSTNPVNAGFGLALAH